MAAAGMTPAEQMQYVLDHTPGLTPPPGVEPNFVDPYNKRYLVVASTAATLTATTLFVLVRTYTKRFIHKSGLGREDYLSLLAWMLYIGHAILGYQTIHYGGYVHQWNVPASKVMKFMQIVNELTIVYGIAVLVAKLSILFQLLSIFASLRTGAAYYVCHIMIWFNILFYTAITFVEIFVCTPRARFWDPLVPGKCIPHKEIINVVTSATNAASDLVLLLLPIICVWRLQMSLKQKLGVSAVFATAAFACVSSIMRIVTSVQVLRTSDLTWTLLPEGLWALGEISSGIICGCMPALPQFFRHFIPKITTAFSNSSGRSSGRGKSIAPDVPIGLAEQKGNARGSRAKYPKSPYGDTESYVELNERDYGLKSADGSKAGLRVWTDEVSATDEEKL